MIHYSKFAGLAAILILAFLAMQAGAHTLFFKPATFFVAQGQEVVIPLLNGTFETSANRIKTNRMESVTIVAPAGDELDVEDSGTPGVYMMDTARLRTTNMNNGTSGEGTIVTGPLDPIGDAPINDAHGYTEVALEMFTQMGHPNSIDDAGFKLVSRVHYDSGYDNAFWDGTQMTYGDGAVSFYPLLLDYLPRKDCVPIYVRQFFQYRVIE